MTWLEESIRAGRNIFRRAAEMADHKHGDMEITTQEKTFDGFMRFTTKSVIIIILLLVGMAIFIT
ncbi:aa3-type cytochrome c oxidase subunit IV [Roseobacter sp. EG26]|uniref:aa3-type cytochrome c oxidase subunit IV n=1 Tax=Roseobacter sp. EG26 TaxID=3412477 RepID=UPI003CE5079F